MINTINYRKNWIRAALVCCLFVYGCENDPNTIKELTQSNKMVEEARNIETLFSQNGRMKSKLTAPLMFHFYTDSSYFEFPKSLHVNFFDSTGKMESHMDALYGKYFENQDKVYLRDSVFIYNVKGDTLWSPDLWWDQRTHKFYTDKKVRIHKNGDRIYGGEGLEANQDLSEINIRQITGIIVNVPDSLTKQ
ncbi:MAG TPA: LPS export ABC transporter periplasmic protein LptC [Flavisolibacter sp.]|nr:LPS export ABC transporter periplasmic protein LptC [Flavisolibacter sp.]